MAGWLNMRAPSDLFITNDKQMNQSKHQHLRKKVFLPGEAAPLNQLTEAWKSSNQEIVFTNGCFDIMHAGHVDYLAKAAELGDVLVVGLNTDASVHRLKGTGRPIVPEEGRAMLLAGLYMVDAVVLFDEDEPTALIKQISPKLLVKGGDYCGKKIAGSDHVRSTNGKVITIPLLPGYSTSNIIRHITKLCNSGKNDR